MSKDMSYEMYSNLGNVECYIRIDGECKKLKLVKKIEKERVFVEIDTRKPCLKVPELKYIFEIA